MAGSNTFWNGINMIKKEQGVIHEYLYILMDKSYNLQNWMFGGHMYNTHDSKAIYGTQ